MEDSFEQRIKGQKPSSVQPKANKGWMLFSIVLLVILIAGGVFAGVIIAKGNRDTNKLSEVEQQVKEKDQKITDLEAKIAELEQSIPEYGQTTPILDHNVNYSDLIDTLMSEGTVIYITKTGVTSDGKYYFVKGDTDDSHGFGAFVFYYKEAKNGAQWKLLHGGHATPLCSEFTDEERTLLNKYFSDELNFSCN